MHPSTESKLSEVATLLNELTEEVFLTMLGVEVRQGETELSGTPATPESGILAMIGIAGAVSGSVCIQISNSLACELASKFLMADYLEVDADVLDAIAELANMIVGGLKTRLEDRFGSMGLSLPTVISAERYIARSPASEDRFTISFHCPHKDGHETFRMHTCLLDAPSGNMQLRELATLNSRIL
jgi:chemotaxis protein CheX